MENKWFYTDDLQICRIVHPDVYEFCEFTQADTNIFVFAHDKVILDNWRDSDGDWDNDAKSIVSGYYKSLDEIPADGKNQIIAECIFEQTGQLDSEAQTMTLEEAEEYLKGIINGIVVP